MLGRELFGIEDVKKPVEIVETSLDGGRGEKNHRVGACSKRPTELFLTASVFCLPDCFFSPPQRFGEVILAAMKKRDGTLSWLGCNVRKLRPPLQMYVATEFEYTM